MNSEIFARVLFSRTSHMQSFVKIETSRNGENTLLFTDIVTSCPSHKFLMPQIFFFNAIRENKILMEISGFTVR